MVAIPSDLGILESTSFLSIHYISLFNAIPRSDLHTLHRRQSPVPLPRAPQLSKIPVETSRLRRPGPPLPRNLKVFFPQREGMVQTIHQTVALNHHTHRRCLTSTNVHCFR
jgi:hypothetical protein